METNEFQKRLEDDPELARRLKDALEGNAGAEELSGILADAGLDSEVVEALIAGYQRKRGEGIAVQELDDNALDQVAGGYTSVKKWWEENNCSNQFSTGKYSNGMEVCGLTVYCDDFFVYYF